MYNSIITGTGYYVPENIVTNDDLSKLMDTSDAWIQERTGIQQRRFATRGKDTTTSMGVRAAQMAMEKAKISKEDIDFLIFATLSPDYYFPGCCISSKGIGTSYGRGFGYSQPVFRLYLCTIGSRPIY